VENRLVKFRVNLLFEKQMGDGRPCIPREIA